MSTHNICFCEEKKNALLQIRADIHITDYLFVHKNVWCGYSLEKPWLGTSNEYI